MWRRLISFSGILLLGVIHVMNGQDPSYLFFILPFMLLYILYLCVNENYIGALINTVFSVSLIIYAVVQAKNLVYLWLILVSVLVFLLLLWYQKKWSTRIADVESKQKIVQKDMEALEDRHHARLDSLKHLEDRVNGLIHLFEIARDFNECINFSEVLHVLDQKISQEIRFSKGMLIISKASKEQLAADEIAKNIFVFGPRKNVLDAKTEALADECVKMLGDGTVTIRIESEEQDDKKKFAEHSIVYPLWVLPLVIEHRVIAVLIIEGGTQNDFQKIEILAAQLALQVKKVQLYETVKEISIVDGLTNVFVRRHFFERFHEELKRACKFQFPLSVLMVDVDHFKSYNDKFGHLVGDKTLREVAQIIRENVRRVDVLGRYGGEEFAIVAPEIGKNQGIDLAERIRSAVARKKFVIYDEEAQVTVSIGVSSFPDDVKNKPLSEYSESFLTDLIEKADEALYKAKQEGRNRVVAHNI